MNRTCLLLLAGLISSPAAAAEVREAVRQDWAFQHRLAVDTDRAGNLVLKRQRQPAPLLDEQAGTLKDDRDPTDQVARRTDALVAHLAKTWPGQADWEGFRRRLDPLLAEAKAGQPDLTGKDPARQKTFRFNITVHQSAGHQWVMWQGTGGNSWKVGEAGVVVLAD